MCCWKLSCLHNKCPKIDFHLAIVTSDVKLCLQQFTCLHGMSKKHQVNILYIKFNKNINVNVFPNIFSDQPGKR